MGEGGVCAVEVTVIIHVDATMENIHVLSLCEHIMCTDTSTEDKCVDAAETVDSKINESLTLLLDSNVRDNAEDRIVCEQDGVRIRGLGVEDVVDGDRGSRGGGDRDAVNGMCDLAALLDTIDEGRLVEVAEDETGAATRVDAGDLEGEERLLKDKKSMMGSNKLRRRVGSPLRNSYTSGLIDNGITNLLDARYQSRHQ